MAPSKKPKGTKMGLQDFLLNDEFGTSTGNWADDVEENLNITSDSQLRSLGNSRTDNPFGRPGFSDRGAYGNDRFDRFSREPRPIPDDPPYKAHVGGLPFDLAEEDLPDAIRQAFIRYDVQEISPITSSEKSRFAFVIFGNREDLITVAGDNPEPTFVGEKKVFVSVADRRDAGRRPQMDGRDLDWGARRGPLPPDTSRSQYSDRQFNDRSDRSDRPARDFGAARRAAPPDLGSGGGSGGGSEQGDRYQERRAPREQAPARNLDWSVRSGPLSPKADDRPSSRSNSRPSGVPMDSRSDSFRGRGSPAAWPEGREGGSRPPRREFSDRPERGERTPTAAEKDMAWRSNMRPVAPAVASSNHSGEGSEAPPSPAGPASAAARGGRPVLHLAKRTVSENPDVISPAPMSSDPKSNPFGAARPIDTAAREREIAVKRESAAKAKLEAEQKAKEERIAQEKAAAEAAEAARIAEAEEAEKKAAQAAEDAKIAAEQEEKNRQLEAEKAAKAKEPVITSPVSDIPYAPREAKGSGAERKLPTRSRDFRERELSNQKPSRAVESNWRTASGESRVHRGGGGSGGGARGRGGRGGRGDGGRFNDRDRPVRPNGSGAAPAVEQPLQSPGREPTSAPSTPGPEDDGWTTVKQTRRTRPMA